MPSQQPVTHLRSLWHAPAARALLHQTFAFLMTGLGLAVLEAQTGMQPGLASAACAQGVLAAAISYWRRLAPWWLPMQLLFPVMVVGMQALQLPPLLFLLLFLGLLGLYWSTFRTQVPYYPSNRLVWQAVAVQLPPDRPLRFIDIGSGFGGLVLYLAKIRRDSLFSGIELAPLPWLVSQLRVRLQRSHGQFLRGDYMLLTFSGYDVVFAYLSPAAMTALWEKAHTEMRPGSLLLSYEFLIPGHAPDLIISPAPGLPALYGWRM